MSVTVRSSPPAFDRAYFFARHAQAICQRPMFRAEAFPEGTDWPLSRAGEAQARALGRELARAGCERIVSSALLRARRTAELAHLESGIPYGDAWPALDEISPRSLLHRPGPRERPEWWEGVAGAWHLRRHLRGVASETRDVAAIERRIRGVLLRLDAMPHRRIAIVGHAYFVFLLALVVPGRARLRPMRNCSITRVEADGHGSHRLAGFAERSIDARR